MSETTTKKVIESGIEYRVTEYAFGDIGWRMDDDFHREDGPAYEYASGSKEWFLNGRLVYSDEQDNTSIWKITDKMKLQIIK